MHYNTDDDNSKGPIFMYRPYPPEKRKTKLNKFQITLRVILAAVIIAAVSCLMPIKRAVAIDPAIVLKGE